MGYRIDSSYFDNNDDMSSNNIQDILSEDEQILWQQQPKKSAYIWSRVLTMLPIVVIWVLFDGAFIFGAVSSGLLSSLPTIAVVGLCLFFLVHLAPVWIWIVGIIRGVAEHKNVHYVVTDKRLIVRTGIIADIKIVDFASLQSVNCRVGLVDRMLHVGDLYITYSGGKVVLFDIANPYQISNTLQQIITDVKADMYYPNALRPDSNDGYNTKYNNDKF